MQETMFGTYANCTAQAHKAAKNGAGPSRLKPLHPSANEYYMKDPDARFKTNKGNKSHLMLGDERDWRMTSNNMEMIRPASEPLPRHEPLVDGFDDMSFDEREQVYRTALNRAGMQGVKQLEKSIRDKIAQRTSGGPFALRKAFKYFDRDGSGSIDPDEFYAAMDFFGLQFTADQVLGLFGTYDDDRSGSLEYYEFVEKLLDEGMGRAQNEMKHYLSALATPSANVGMSLHQARRASMSSVQKMFGKFDANNSGQIDVRELRFFLEKLGMLASTDVVTKVMEQLDVDNNEEISWEEFWAWWQKNHSCSPSPSPERDASPGRPSAQNTTANLPSRGSRRDQNREDANQQSRGATPSPEVQQLRARFGRPSAPSRQNMGTLDFPERPLPSRGSLFSRGSSLGNFAVGPKWCEAPDTEPLIPSRGSRGISRGDRKSVV